MATPVYLEVGTKKVFACAVDWPGWCRSAKTEDDALEALAAYADRYRPVVADAGVRFPKAAAAFEVVEHVPGDSSTDFGVPHAPCGADGDPLTAAQAKRLAAIVEASWATFDRVAAAAPRSLRKGPRGGGRDTAKIVAHVTDSEPGYFQKVGLPVQERTRDTFATALRAARQPFPEQPSKPWPWRYAARRVAWHALDHAWEIEDRSD
jgi:hypothetical protein